MAKLAESRDPETGAHLERVRGYCRVLTQQLASLDKFTDQINSEYIRLIYQTSPLHDIGKVGIPDSVLLKPGRLSDREFEIMKEHTTIGAQTLNAALQQFPGIDFLEMARDIALTHHERWDGSGYPRKLAGEQIPLCGRIMALADVYDALTSKRVYKAAYGHEIARAIIVDEIGRQFDPDVVQAFSGSEADFIALRNKLTEPSSIAA
jgi:putative two-component system response regulator